MENGCIQCFGVRRLSRPGALVATEKGESLRRDECSDAAMSTAVPGRLQWAGTWDPTWALCLLLTFIVKVPPVRPSPVRSVPGAVR